VRRFSSGRESDFLYHRAKASGFAHMFWSSLLRHLGNTGAQRVDNVVARGCATLVP
jgi:hypothetical protein